METLEELFDTNSKMISEDLEKLQQLRLEKEELMTKLRFCNQDIEKRQRRMDIRTAENKLIARRNLFDK